MNRTKRTLCDSFKHLMKKIPFDKISISDITDEAGLKRQTFYYHFLDKYELLNYIYYYEIFMPISEILDGDDEKLEDAFKLMFQKISDESYLYRNALQMNASYGFKEYLYSIIEKILIDSSLYDDEESIAIKLYAHGIVGIIIDWIVGKLDYKSEILANKIVKEIKKVSN